MEQMLKRWLTLLRLEDDRLRRRGRLFLERLIHAARSCVRPSARAEGIHRIADALRVRDFGEWQAAFRANQFEIKLMLLLFFAILVGLIVLWLATKSDVIPPRSSVILGS
jgi:hypothetical protein